MGKYLHILAFFLCVSLLAQEPGMKNFTDEDGLPSNEVYRSLIDSKGYLWFATNNGVCYFDGLDFTTLDMEDGLIENTIFGMTEDVTGRIWFTGLSGKLCYYLNGEIYQYSKNALLEKIKDETDLISPGSLHVYDTNDISILYSSGKFVRVLGDSLIVKTLKNGGYIPISSMKQSHQLYISKISNEIEIEFLVVFSDSSKIKYKAKIGKPWTEVINAFLLVEYEDRLLYFIKNKCFMFFRNGKVKEIDLSFTPTYSIKSVESGLWFGTQKQGVLFFEDFNFNKKPKVQFLNSHYITSLQYDQNKRGWVTTLNSGVFNVQSLSITNFLNTFSRKRNNIVQLIKLDSTNVLAFSDKGKMFLLDKHYQLKDVSVSELKNERIYQVKKYGEKIYLATTYHFLSIDTKFFLGKHHSSNISNLIHASIKDFVIKDSILWLATSSGLFFDTTYLKNGKFDLKLVNSDSRSRVSKIIEFDPENNLDTFSYLMYQDLNNIRKIRYRPGNLHLIEKSTFKDERKDGLASANDILIYRGFSLIGTNGNGIFWNYNDSLINFSSKNGLCSNIINKLHIANDSTLIVATNNGINYLHFNSGQPTKIDSISYISKQDGLAGNEINDFLILDNQILCGTNNGLSLINPKAILELQDHYKIYLSAFKVNGENIYRKNTQNYQLKSVENNISISFEALDFHDRKNMDYYYRFYNRNDLRWKKINEPQVNFPLMSAGNYIFQVKAINSYGYESENIAEVRFSIAKTFYQSWFFRVGLIVLIGTLLYIFLRYFFNKRNQLLRTEKQLAEYQQQSLTRLINPHFLMNVFNSISSNLFNKKPGIAMAYIKEISELVKLIFDSAYYNKTTLEEEVKLLKSYINIEKRRSPFTFTEVIKCDPELKDYFIPSLITQIFVENAIHHGFSDFKTKGALLSISFVNEDSCIVCKIVDNGMGISASKKLDKAASHRPRKHGIEIIQERLELLNTNLTKTKYKLEVVELKKDNTAKGTKVKIWFPKLEKKIMNNPKT